MLAYTKDVFLDTGFIREVKSFLTDPLLTNFNISNTQNDTPEHYEVTLISSSNPNQFELSLSFKISLKDVTNPNVIGQVLTTTNVLEVTCAYTNHDEAVQRKGGFIFNAKDTSNVKLRLFSDLNFLNMIFLDLNNLNNSKFISLNDVEDDLTPSLDSQIMICNDISLAPVGTVEDLIRNPFHIRDNNSVNTVTHTNAWPVILLDYPTGDNGSQTDVNSLHSFVPLTVASNNKNTVRIKPSCILISSNFDGVGNEITLNTTDKYIALPLYRENVDLQYSVAYLTGFQNLDHSNLKVWVRFA